MKFSSKPENKFGADPFCRFREKRTPIPKIDVIEPKARLL